MRSSTFSQTLLAALASIVLIALPIAAQAQHGGGHAGGGGGGFHGGGGGSFGGGSFHGGGFSGGGNRGGGSYGGYRGGYSGARGFEGGRGFNGNMRGGSSMRNSGAYRPWGSEGRGIRNASPGWHSFERSSNTGSMMARAGNPGMGGRSGNFGAGSRGAAGMPASHAGVRDGQWHGFGGSARNSVGVRSGSTLSASTRSATLVTHGSVASINAAWHGSGWHGGWHGGFWGPGWGWGCCGWGWGWGFGWRWGWGPGWGFGWNPFWAWAPYWYNPWLYADSPAYIYPDAW